MIPVQPLFWAWEKELSSETCDHIISLAKDIPPEKGVVGGIGDDPGRLEHKQRDSDVRWITDNFIVNALLGFGNQANHSSWGMNIDTISSIQFTDYTKEQHYDWHMDTYERGPDMRKVSIIVQLTDSDDYEGGDFQFRHYGGQVEEVPILRQRGTVLVFPSWLEHRVTPVTKGKRQTLVAWMSGPALV